MFSTAQAVVASAAASSAASSSTKPGLLSRAGCITPPAAAIAGHAAACADPYGYCFAVDDCSQMVAGGADPLAVAAYLYGVELETGKLFGKKVPLCSMEPGPKTNPQQCPWSIELA